MSAKAVTCFTSAAASMKQPPAYFGSAAFSHLRWTLAGDQRDERMQLFCRKLLRRLDGMDMPFYPKVGLMDHKTAQQRYVTGADPWSPAESPFLDGVAIEFAHCVADRLERRAWWLFAEVGFDVARLAQIPVFWHGFNHPERPGMFQIWDGGRKPVVTDAFCVDARTYGVRGDRLINWRPEGV